MNTLPTEVVLAANKSTVSTLLTAAKASPLKTGLIALSVTGVIAGSVYGIRKYRAKKQAEQVQELATAAAEAAEDIAESVTAANNKARNKATA